NLFRERGVRLDRTYQLNFGGNSDFKNMLERSRLASKKVSKTHGAIAEITVILVSVDGQRHRSNRHATPNPSISRRSALPSARSFLPAQAKTAAWRKVLGKGPRS
ncbi:hypothetical protein ACIKTA_15675, partial [Hansschlegelia beijingensis]